MAATAHTSPSGFQHVTGGGTVPIGVGGFENPNKGFFTQEQAGHSWFDPSLLFGTSGGPFSYTGMPMPLQQLGMGTPFHAAAGGLFNQFPGTQEGPIPQAATNLSQYGNPLSNHAQNTLLAHLGIHPGGAYAQYSKLGNPYNLFSGFSGMNWGSMNPF